MPANFVEWERALTRHFLMVADSGDASPITSFEVTPATLAEAAGQPSEAAEKAVVAFKEQVCRVHLRDALEHGWYSPAAATDETPGYFSYLILTLLIASQPDEDMRLGGDFHQKLRRFLGVTSGYRALPGVAQMWRKLARWLGEKQSKGLPFRRLELPAHPPAWVHIGFTRKLAFPAKSDATLLRAFLTSHSGMLEQPLNFIRRFEPVLASGRGSDGMAESFEDFKAAFLAGDRFLTEHPFWRLALFCTQRDAADDEVEADVICTFDEDGAPRFSAFSRNGHSLTAGPTTLSQAVAAMGPGGAVAAPTLRCGLVVFRQIGYGRWRSAPGSDGTPGQVHLGCSAAAHLHLRQYRPLFVPSGSWYFTVAPMGAGVADECASLLGAGALADSKLSAVSIFGGVRTGGLWLGRPAFLPRISSDARSGRARPASSAEGDLDVTAGAAGVMRLHSSRPVSGSWFIEPTEGRAWSRRVSFASDAFVHESLHGAAYALPTLREWGTAAAGSVQCAAKLEGWTDAGGRMGDLVEAVYAGGRSGWDEAELIAVIQDAFGREADPWSLLRVLADATVVQPRLRASWKGRVWTLGPPTLRCIGEVALAEGAVCERMAREFRAACASMSVEPFRRVDGRLLAPAVLGCRGDGAGVAERLGWRWIGGADRPKGCLSFEETALGLIGRRPASRWDWTTRRFVVGEREGDGEVRLTRWSQLEGPDHDIYTVERKRDGVRRYLLSRAAAVALAHSMAGVSLFKGADGFLVGMVKEAHLPDRLAAYLRIRHGLNPGLCEGLHVYVVDESDLIWMHKLLPGLLEMQGLSNIKIGAEAVSSARHSGGRIRLAWRGGAIAAIMPGATVMGEG